MSALEPAPARPPRAGRAPRRRGVSRVALGLAAAIAALAAGVEDAAPPEAPRWEFPEGAVARAWAGVGPETAPVATPAPPAEPAARWAAWRADLAAEREAAAPDPARRARLARLALAQGRDADAWRHAAACLAEPGVLLGLAPLLLPGVEPAGDGGLEPLADGAVLAPALPPRDGADAWGPRAMNVAGLAVGAGRVHLEVREDPDGVQVEVAHAGGGPVRLAVALPEPDDRAVRVVYVDWLRQDETSGPFPLELRAGDEPRVVFGRTAPRDAPWTRELPALLPEGIRRAGMRLDVAGLDAAARAELEGLDAALAALLDVPVEVVEARAGEPFAGVRLRLEPDSWRQERNAIVSATERFVLRPPGPGEER